MIDNSQKPNILKKLLNNEAGHAKRHMFCSAGTVEGKGCKTLACALAIKV